jgi:plastocyanin/mono/diheme cytochrome c family protein
LNTSKQVNVIVGLLMIGALATLLYYLWDGERQSSAIERQMEENAERGGFLFSRNCSSCHGLTGKGAIERGGLPGAPLNLEENRPVAPGELAALQNRFRDTIRCGRIGTLMPSWSQEQGGPLNDFQIQQLVTLIVGTFPGEDPLADPNLISEAGWHNALETANHDTEFDPPKELAEAIDADATTLKLNDVSGLLEDAVLRIDEEPVDEVYEVVKIISISEDADEIEVERGAEGSDATEHAEAVEVFNGPIAPGTTVTGESGTPPCGQLAAAQAEPEGTPAPPIEITGNITIEMGDNFFELTGIQNPALGVKAGTPITIDLTNTGSQVHNMQVAGDDGEYGTDDDAISDPDAISGGGAGAVTFNFVQPGTYPYQCEFHPNDMKGEITVTQ